MKEVRGMGKDDQQPTLIYPQHLCSPQDLLHFVEEDEFADDWKSLGLDDDALCALQIAIMAAPKGAPLVRGSGGLRKLRFAPAEWKTGKSGAVRVCYAYFEEHWTVLLLLAYGKGAKESLSKREVAAIKKYLRTVEAYLKERNH
jgi:hypothetical protein